MANISKETYMNKDNLKLAFNFFDENNDGSISIKELQRIFSKSSKNVLDGVMSENDSNGDGEVLFL